MPSYVQERIIAALINELKTLKAQNAQLKQAQRNPQPGCGLEVSWGASHVLYYLGLRGRAEPARMIMNYSDVHFEDITLQAEEWKALKPTFPQGDGAEFPGREKGNRGLPVLKLPSGEMMPESLRIVEYIVENLVPPRLHLVPSDQALALEAKEMAQDANVLPMFWPLPALVRFPQPAAEHVIKNDGDGIPPHLKFPTGKGIREWCSEFPKYSEAMPRMQMWAKKLAERGAPFFGGAQPHYGEFSLWNCVDAICDLEGREETFALFAECVKDSSFADWFDRIRNLPGVREYLERRPPNGHPDAGYPNTIVVNYTTPSKWRTDAPDVKPSSTLGGPAT
jgi:glutathione S-transferase